MPSKAKPDLGLILMNHAEWLKLVYFNRSPLTEEQMGLRGNLDGLYVEREDFSHCDLSYMSMEGTHFENCRFFKARLKGAWALDVQFNDCILAQADLSNVYGKQADFVGSNLRDADLSHSVWLDADFMEADLTGASAVGSFFRDPPFEEAKGKSLDMRFSHTRH